MADHTFPGKSKGTLAVKLEHGEALIFTGLANPRPFKTGSEGYSVNGKATGTDGAEYQVSVNVIRVKSDEEGAPATERQKVALLIQKDKQAEREKRAKGRK